MQPYAPLGAIRIDDVYILCMKMKFTFCSYDLFQPSYFTWNLMLMTGVNEEQFQDTLEATERAIMSSIYKFAFHPNGEIDIERDK